MACQRGERLICMLGCSVDSGMALRETGAAADTTEPKSNCYHSFKRQGNPRGHSIVSNVCTHAPAT
jgi:hypothetical protein